MDGSRATCYTSNASPKTKVEDQFVGRFNSFLVACGTERAFDIDYGLSFAVIVLASAVN